MRFDKKDTCSRRKFIKKIMIGAGTMFVLDRWQMMPLSEAKFDKQPVYSMIAVDYDKCSGCRTCEAVCSAQNHRQFLEGKILAGLGNPFLSNIRVSHFNPDVDVPIVCVMCPDAPCIEACPVGPDPVNGRKAVFRDENTYAVKNDVLRCIGCGRCAEACRTQRVGIIVENPQTNKPERMCTLCDGDPQCVRYCPYGALSYVPVEPEKEFYGMPPDTIATLLAKRFYHNK